MKQILFWGVILFQICAQANLLSRIQVEESYRQKLQNYITLYDERARVVLKFDYKKIDGNLPGTSLNASEEAPSIIDTKDINSAKVYIISSKDKFEDKFADALKELLPVSSGKISIIFEKMTPEMIKVEQEAIKAQDLRDISISSVESLVNRLMILFFAIYGLSVAAFAYFHSKKTKEFRTQMGQLQEALLSQSATPISQPIMQDVGPNRLSSPALPHANSEEISMRQLNNLADDQLLAILSDCYWCHMDEEASWIWKRLENTTKKNLITAWSPLEEYSKYLLTIEEMPTTLYQDTYYFFAKNLNDVSNEDFAKILEKSPQAWHSVSSLRKKTIPISLELGIKLRTLDSSNKNFDFSNLPKSKVREFTDQNYVSDLSPEEELKILNNPDFIPQQMRSSVPSLCWLAQKNEDYISSVLSQFDARALATAWVGPDDVLKKFEDQISEKKLKALHSYLQSAKPSRQSSTFMKLHQLGIMDEAA